MSRSVEDLEKARVRLAAVEDALGRLIPEVTRPALAEGLSEERVAGILEAAAVVEARRREVTLELVAVQRQMADILEPNRYGRIVPPRELRARRLGSS